MDQPPFDWITLATTPPSSPADLDRLMSALSEKGIAVELEKNPLRQCDQDVATWLRVHSRDLHSPGTSRANSFLKAHVFCQD